MQTHVLILCGDTRLDRLASLLEQKEQTVTRLVCLPEREALEELLSENGSIVLPTPVSRDGTHLSGDTSDVTAAALFEALTPAHRLFGGGFSVLHQKLLAERGANVFDFMEDEGFVRYNAALTAQGALRLLLQSFESLLRGKRILITGFGRVGKAIAGTLTALGCECYVAARGALQRQDAVLSGCKALTLDEMRQCLFLFDAVCNTVPCPLFSREDLLHCKKGCRYLELCFSPSGAEKSDCLYADLCYLDGKGLPGRFCPLSSAQRMLTCIEAT